jgi:hypothetical protein
MHAWLKQEAEPYLALGAVKKANRIDKVEPNPSW